MSLMQIDIGYFPKEKIEQLPEEVWRRLMKALPDYFTEHGDNKERRTGYGDQVADDEEARLLSDCGIKFEIKRFRGNTRPEDFRGGSQGVPDGAGAVHFHLPNFSLFSVTEVRLIEDCCTDALQEQRNDGWRIIAVCPPLNARRPDYILGRCGESTRE